MSAETLHIPLGKDAYDIIIGNGILAQAAKWLTPVLPSTRVIIVADEAIASPYLAQLTKALEEQNVSTESITITSGEQSKSFAQYEALMQQLLSFKPDRKTTLIALGGGVIGDLVGFAASSLMRGVPYIQIPTTLLSQVDSSVGGKTGINTTNGKNLVGSFYQPKRVLIDTATLGSLPERQLRAGYAEIVKYAMLGDARFFDWLEQNGAKLLNQQPMALGYGIKTCCSMKGQVVEWDEKENDVRALLNLGHTFGHALEAEAGYDDRLVHGEAVSIGMVMAARLSNKLGMCHADVEERLVAHLSANGLPCKPEDIKGVSWDADAIASHFASDKKAQNGKLAFVCLRSIGDAELIRDVDPAVAHEVVKAFL